MTNKERYIVTNLFEKQIDGSLSQKEAEQLQYLIFNNSQIKQFYLDISIQHVAIQEHTILLKKTKHSTIKVQGWTLSNTVTKSFAAACLIFSFSMWYAPDFLSLKNSVGTLTETHHCLWEGSSSPTFKGYDLSPGDLKLSMGIAEITMDSGVKLTLEAPAHLILLDSMNVDLQYGHLIAEVPDSGKGFSVVSPDAKFIDHGTVFSVSRHKSIQDSGSQISVIDGEVEVIDLSKNDDIRLFTGESGIAQTHQFTPIKNEENTFADISTFHKENQYHLSTSHGKGLAMTVVRDDDHEFHYKKDLILLKKSRIKTLNRRGYLFFDLSSVPNRDLYSVRLRLNMTPTGLGTTTTMHRPKFSVYAIIDDHDELNPESLRWNNAPGTILNSDAFDLKKTVKIGDFSLSKGEVERSIDIQSDKLKDLIEADTNKILSFVVLRETNDGPYDNIVHGFANDYHESVTGPKLIFKFQ
jgi:hypothetical protein